MGTPDLSAQYANISQRTALAYLRSLAPFAPSPGADPASQQALHNFFRAFYQAMYDDPAAFGLPVKEDVSIPGDHRIDQKARQEINKKHKKIKEIVEQALTLLIAAGSAGRLEGDSLVLAADEALEKQLKALRRFLPGLARVGLTIERSPLGLALRSPGFAGMLPALQDLARLAAADPALGRFHFTRCDFKALAAGGGAPEPLEMYRVFNDAEYERVAALHSFFQGLGYQAAGEFRDVSAWTIKYQGSRKIKASPLFQVDFMDTQQSQARVFIKCAGANRITPLLPEQSPELREDFYRRANRCNAPHCQWCKTRKGMGPSSFEHNGERVVVCWYVNSDVHELDDQAVALIQEYALMHEKLA